MPTLNDLSPFQFRFGLALVFLGLAVLGIVVDRIWGGKGRRG